MNQSLLSPFGGPLQRVENALHELRQVKGVLVIDDEAFAKEHDMVALSVEDVVRYKRSRVGKGCAEG